MKRRKAIRDLAILSAGVAMLPSCELDKIPVYSNIPLEPEQREFMSWVTQSILPFGNEPSIITPESTQHFVLTMVNDCFEPEEIEEYSSGFKLLNQYILDEYGINYRGLNSEQRILMFTEISNSEIVPKSLQFFLNSTKDLCIRHFTSAQYFMENHLYYEFVPGRFNGCVPLEKLS